MKYFHLTYLFALLMFFLSGCATLHRPNEQLAAVLSSYHVPQETYDKMIYGREIEYSDIMNLERSKVPSPITTKYLNDYNTDCMEGELEETKRKQESERDNAQFEHDCARFKHDSDRHFKKFKKSMKFH